jgi:glycosyltransferase involved in cell wall biosynthesis
MYPKVSIVVTVYKRLQFLKEALECALRQTYTSFEIIVTDDSQSESIKAICDSLNDCRIRYRMNSVTLGVALNLRAAISESKGDYISILNDDDAWEPDFLTKVLPALDQNPNCVLSFSDHWLVTESGLIDYPRSMENSARYARSNLPGGKVENLDHLVLVHNGVPLAMASVFRKDAIDIDLLVQDVSGAYDFWIACLLASSNKSAYYVPERLTRYRVHGEMETARKAPDKNINLAFIYRKLIELDAFPGKGSFLNRKYSQALYRCGRDNLLFGRLE